MHSNQIHQIPHRTTANPKACSLPCSNPVWTAASGHPYPQPVPGDAGSITLGFISGEFPNNPNIWAAGVSPFQIWAIYFGSSISIERSHGPVCQVGLLMIWHLCRLPYNEFCTRNFKEEKWQAQEETVMMPPLISMSSKGLQTLFGNKQEEERKGYPIYNNIESMASAYMMEIAWPYKRLKVGNTLSQGAVGSARRW